MNDKERYCVTAKKIKPSGTGKPFLQARRLWKYFQ